MIAFIDEHRAIHGVEPICRVLPIAPSTYHAHAARRADPGKLPARAQRDVTLRIEIRRVHEENFRVYGVRKVWRQLLREGIVVARCTVARLMRTMGLQGVVRGKTVRTTISNAAAPCPLDRVNRQFKAPHPNALWVSDFTYVATWAGFVYVAFVIDVFARRIVGWRVSRTAHAGFVLDASMDRPWNARQKYSVFGKSRSCAAIHLAWCRGALAAGPDDIRSSVPYHWCGLRVRCAQRVRRNSVRPDLPSMPVLPSHSPRDGLAYAASALLVGWN